MGYGVLNAYVMSPMRASLDVSISYGLSNGTHCGYVRSLFVMVVYDGLGNVVVLMNGLSSYVDQFI
jgi:hypothetical protein